MTKMTGPDCTAMRNLINTHKHTYKQKYIARSTLDLHNQDAQRTSMSMTLPPDVLNLLNMFISANRFCCPPDRERHNDVKCMNDNPPHCDALFSESFALVNTLSCGQREASEVFVVRVRFHRRERGRSWGARAAGNTIVGGWLRRSLVDECRPRKP